MSTAAGHLGAETYNNKQLADFFAGLEIDGTYRLAFRDLAATINRHVTGKRALDFGCGAGRTTRLLKTLGFDTVGADISDAMLQNARLRDPGGVYVRGNDGNLSGLGARNFDLVLSAFPLCSVTQRDNIVTILSALRSLLLPGGRLISIEATDRLYCNEWVSFSMAAFPENARAGSGDPVTACFRERMDEPVVDTLWTDEDYHQCHRLAGLTVLEVQHPLATEDDPGPWISEMHIPPWVIYVLAADRE